MQQLLQLLKAKGVVNDSEAAELKSAADADTLHSLVDTESGPTQYASLTTPGSGQAAAPKEAPAGPVVIPAIAPVRVLPIDAPVKEGLAPALKLGAVRMTPYGFIKATAAYDSSSPRGDDFPPPGFLNADTGPTNNAEFHVKARANPYGCEVRVAGYLEECDRHWPNRSRLRGQLQPRGQPQRLHHSQQRACSCVWLSDESTGP